MRFLGKEKRFRERIGVRGRVGRGSEDGALSLLNPTLHFSPLVLLLAKFGCTSRVRTSFAILISDNSLELSTLAHDYEQLQLH